MKTSYTFEREWRTVGRLPQFDQTTIKNEPMMFSADLEFAEEHGGIITRQFVSMLRNRYCEDVWIIDSRTHMLMPNWYPCIPGWHHDDVIRDRPDGQPNYDPTPSGRQRNHSEHVMAVFGTTAMPQFAVQEKMVLEVDYTVDPASGKMKNIYNQFDDQLVKMNPATYTVQSGEVIEFTWQDIHRGMPATENGWRFFIRASSNTKRPFFNELRKQVQVYLPTPNEGW